MCIKNGIIRVFGEKKTTATDFEKQKGLIIFGIIRPLLIVAVFVDKVVDKWRELWISVDICCGFILLKGVR